MPHNRPAGSIGPISGEQQFLAGNKISQLENDQKRF